MKLNKIAGLATFLLIAATLLPSCATNGIPAPKPGTVTRVYVDGPFGQMHFYHAGDPKSDKTPLLLLHPTPSSGIFYHELIDEMSQDRYVISPDTPGFGRSDPPPEPQTIEALTEALKTVVDALDLNEFDILGHHTGTVLGTEMAVTMPGRVRRLVLLGVPYYETREQREAMYENFANREIRQDPEYISGFWRAHVEIWRKPNESLATAARGFAERMQSYPRWEWGYHAVFSYDMHGNLPKVTQPALVPNLPDSPPDQARLVSERLANATYLPDSGLPHRLFYSGDQSGLFELTREFLD